MSLPVPWPEGEGGGRGGVGSGAQGAPEIFRNETAQKKKNCTRLQICIHWQMYIK